MFDNLSDRLGGVFDRLKGRGALKEQDVRDAMREVRVALLEADVALPVARRFIDAVTEKAVGQDVLRSVTPGQQVVKIVHDELVAMLSGDGEDGAADAMGEGLNFEAKPPVVIMMVGLQGSGKTTTTAKLGKLIRERHGKKAMMASLDVNRPAAQEQLAVLGEQVDVATLPIVAGQQPVDIARRAMESARLQNFDVLLLDSLTGQDAVNVAQSFSGEVPLTGVVLTRMDGDARGGAALSMRAVTGKPIKFAGTGEKLDAIETFRPSSVADRILGMGDVVSLVEKAAATIKEEEAAKLAENFEKGKFDLNDLRMQLQQMQNMGGLGMLAGMMPGMKKAKQAMAAADMDDKVLVHMDAIIGSMTAKERANPALMNAKRKKRVAAGSGTDVQAVNKLLKMHKEMSRAMKQLRKMGGLKSLAAMFGAGGGGGMPPGMGGAGGLGGPGGPMGGLPGLGGPGAPGGLPPGLPGLGRPKKK